MKKYALIALLLTAVLALTACGNPATFAEADPAKYLTLGTYKGIAYTPTDASVSDYEVTVAMNNALNEKGYAKTDDTTLKEGTVQIGDTLNIDYKGLKDGVAFDGGTATGQSLTIGSGQFIAGFEEGLVGKAIGSDVKLHLTFPKDYGSADLAGQAVIFEVKINAVTKRTTYSKLDDTVAKDLDENAKTAEEYLGNLRTDLENKKKAAAKDSDTDTLWGAAIANTTFKDKLPKKLVENSVKEFKNYHEAFAKQNSFTSLEDFVKGQGWTMDFFNQQAEAYGENIVKSQLTAYAIAKAEGHTITDEFINKSAEKYAAQYGYSSAAKYINDVGKDVVTDQAILDYAVDFVVANAKAE